MSRPPLALEAKRRAPGKGRILQRPTDLPQTRPTSGLTDALVFRRLFDFMLVCEPSVPVDKTLFSEVQAWAVKIETGSPIETGEESWGAIFNSIVWDKTLAEDAPRVSVAILNVYGHFAEMTLQNWEFSEVWLPAGVALAALARLQPKPLIKVVEASPMRVHLLPEAKPVLGLQGSVELSCPPFDLDFTELIFRICYYGVDTYNGALDVEGFFKPFDRSTEPCDADFVRP